MAMFSISMLVCHVSLHYQLSFHFIPQLSHMLVCHVRLHFHVSLHCHVSFHIRYPHFTPRNLSTETSSGSTQLRTTKRRELKSLEFIFHFCSTASLGRTDGWGPGSGWSPRGPVGVMNAPTRVTHAFVLTNWSKLNSLSISPDSAVGCC